MKTFNFGIIGAANIANKFCEAVKLLPNAKVIAVASATVGKAETFAENNNIEHSYSTYEEMLDRDDIDAVYIATTHNFHHQNAMLCIEKGKPFICEKSFMPTYAQALEVFTAAKQKNLFCMEAMWSRFLPPVNKMKSWINEGRLGEIDLATNTIGFHAEENPKNRMYNKNLGGGAMLDIGVYAIEVMTYLIPEKLYDVKSVVRNSTLGEVDKVDSMILQFKNCVASLNCVISANVVGELNIYGTKGRIRMENPHYGSDCELICDDGTVEHFHCDIKNGFVYQIKEVIDCITAGNLESEVIPHCDTLLCAEIFDSAMHI